MSRNNTEWLALQKKIFTRWVNQKLNVASLAPISDFVAEAKKNPRIIVTLLELLSEKKFNGKMNKGSMRVMLIDNAGEALKFAQKECGISMKQFPSSEDIIDGQEKSVLGFLWAIMMKYMKFEGEEGESTLNAKDSLLLWCKNKTQGYKNCKVENLTTSFHDGIALCALIHKHRPTLIPNMDNLSPSKGKENILLAMDAAEKYFGLEKYITPEELVKLDENSMTVYISEYYYGIAEQRKVDLAARRIAKLIAFTKQNDAAKLAYNEEATKLVEHMKKVGLILGDRTIDNTMAGAKKRIDDFYVYKSKDKNEIIQSQLTLEAVYNNLSMILAQHKRPDYNPPAGCSLKDVEATVAELEKCEVERKVALHAELNRQINLVSLDEQHDIQFGKFNAWADEKRAYLQKKEQVDSVGVANYQIACLDAYDADAKGMKETSVADLTSQAQYMDSEKYENIARVNERVNKANETCNELAELSAAKRPVLEDDLAREEFKERVRLMNENSSSIYKRLMAWIEEKEKYLNIKEEVDSINVAQEKLAVLESYEQEKLSMNDTFISMLKDIDQKIKDSVYETQYSSWKFETPETLDQREQEIEQGWNKLSDLSAKKKAILEDDLAREQFNEKLRLMDKEHAEIHQQIVAWVAEKEAYLNIKEQIDSVALANTHLALLEAYETEKIDTDNSNCTQLRSLGQEIINAEYKTEYSESRWNTPEEITKREENVAELWQKLADLSAHKLAVLQDDLAREQFNDKLRTMNKNHLDKYEKLVQWIEKKTAYLNTREEIHSVTESQLHLNLLESYTREKLSQTNTRVSGLKKLGEEIRTAEYKTEFSEARWPTPEEVTERETSIDNSWATLDELYAEKKRVLDDHLARETYAAETRILNRGHIDKSDNLTAWVNEKKAYLTTKESIDSLSEAQTQLSLLDAYDVEKEAMTKSSLASMKALGVTINERKYETQYSSYVFENPAEIAERESAMDQLWIELDQLKNAKKEVLDADLKREQEKEKLRLEFASIAEAMHRWSKQTIDKVDASHFGFTLEEVQAYAETMKKDDEAILAKADEQIAQATEVQNKENEMGIKENIYTKDTPETLGAVKEEVNVKLAERKQKYDVELQRQIANDNLCKEFAAAADPFAKSLSDEKDKITHAKEPLDEQLKYVNEKIANIGEFKTILDSIKAISDKMDAAGISNNRHTTLTAKDAEVLLEQFGLFLEKKKTMLEQEIENEKLRGLTQEQMDEIEQNFLEFDVNKDNNISKKELKALLYSLGEEKSPSEVDAILKKYGNGSEMNKEGFREYMIAYNGDSDTKEEMMNSFKLINKSESVINKERMDMVMKAEDIEYILSTAPKVEGGNDYKAWVEEMFSR